MRARVGRAAALALLWGSGCTPAATAPSVQDLALERAAWTAHHLTRYAYVYEVTGFNIGFTGRPIRLVVLGDTVRSATDVATNDSIPVVTGFPTLDGLFDQAQAALAAGTLTAIQFAPIFDYPSRMDLSGPPDASGSVLASNLELLP